MRSKLSRLGARVQHTLLILDSRLYRRFAYVTYCGDVGLNFGPLSVSFIEVSDSYKHGARLDFSPGRKEVQVSPRAEAGFVFSL